jgi:hypothetical protein
MSTFTPLFLASRMGLFAGVCLMAVTRIGAEEAKTGDTKEPATSSGKEEPAKAYKVTRVQGRTNEGGKATAQLGDTIRVTVLNLAELRKEAKAKSEEIILFLDERPVKKAIESPRSDPVKNELQFQLKRNEESRELWTSLLGSPPSERKRTVKVSVGLENGYAIPSEQTIDLWIIPGYWVLAWFLLMVSLLGLFLWCAVTTDVLRDFGTQPADGTTRKPFSLARVQAAWWFFLVLTSFLFIGMITGDFNTTITESILVLMGISAGTVVGSAVVDATKTTTASDANQKVICKSKLDEVKASVNALNREIAPLTGDVRAQKQQELTAKLAEQTVLESEVKKLSNHTENFFLDILSDIHGVSFHRFQILAWTLILGIIFIVDVYKDLAMPQFDNKLLMLMGISAGTYLGLKIPEQNTPLANVAAPAVPAAAVLPAAPTVPAAPVAPGVPAATVAPAPALAAPAAQVATVVPVGQAAPAVAVAPLAPPAAPAVAPVQPQAPLPRNPGPG